MTNKEKWEDEFDEKFHRPLAMENIVPQLTNRNAYLDHSDIKAYIRTLLQKEREEARREAIGEVLAIPEPQVTIPTNQVPTDVLAQVSSWYQDVMEGWNNYKDEIRELQTTPSPSQGGDEEKKDDPASK